MSATVLVVDDNATIRWCIVQQLQLLGIEAYSAANGKQALELVAERSFHMILMDIDMPECNGYEATREIRRQERKHCHDPVPIVAITAGGHRGDCLNAGMNDYIAKPVLVDDLERLINRWVPSNTQHRQHGS